EVDGVAEEVLDRAALGAGGRLEGRDLVDEEAVALVRGDAAGRRVRLGDAPALLERRHVVADRGRGDPEGVTLDEHPGTDGLARLDVVLHDGAQHIEAPFVAHPNLLPCQHSTMPSANPTRHTL